MEWTNQHGCGGNEDDNPNKLNCQLILQYMCEPARAANQAVQKDDLRDGTTTNQQNYNAIQGI